jgi:xanthine dehydrogenase accessory factor
MTAPKPLPISRTAGPDAVLRAAADALRDGRDAVLATVVARRGSTPGTPGQKLVVLSPTEAVGTIGGGALEARLLAEMVELLGSARTEPVLRHVELGPELGMSCGGDVDVMIEPLGAAATVLVVGAGHVGATLGPLLRTLGFRVVLCDDREPIVTALAQGLDRTSTVTLVCGAHDSTAVAQALGPVVERSAALVMTHNHEHDEEALEWALRAGFALVGGVGSRRKVQRLRASLLERGVAAERVAAMRMPLGVEIGARTPAEIAVSIAAEIVAWRSRVRAPAVTGEAPKAPGA